MSSNSAFLLSKNALPFLGRQLDSAHPITACFDTTNRANGSWRLYVDDVDVLMADIYPVASSGQAACTANGSKACDLRHGIGDSLRTTINNTGKPLWCAAPTHHTTSTAPHHPPTPPANRFGNPPSASTTAQRTPVCHLVNLPFNPQIPSASTPSTTHHHHQVHNHILQHTSPTHTTTTTKTSPNPTNNQQQPTTTHTSHHHHHAHSHSNTPRPPRFVPQAFGNQEGVQREPSVGEERAFVYTAVIAGATGEAQQAQREGEEEQGQEEGQEQEQDERAGAGAGEGRGVA